MTKSIELALITMYNQVQFWSQKLKILFLTKQISLSSEDLELEIFEPSNQFQLAI